MQCSRNVHTAQVPLVPHASSVLPVRQAPFSVHPVQVMIGPATQTPS
jgi:hypothetical protein